MSFLKEEKLILTNSVGEFSTSFFNEYHNQNNSIIMKDENYESTYHLMKPSETYLSHPQIIASNANVITIPNNSFNYFKTDSGNVGAYYTNLDTNYVTYCETINHEQPYYQNYIEQSNGFFSFNYNETLNFVNSNESQQENENHPQQQPPQHQNEQQQQHRNLYYPAMIYPKKETDSDLVSVAVATSVERNIQSSCKMDTNHKDGQNGVETQSDVKNQKSIINNKIGNEIDLETKLRMKRERNRLAARKCRNKKLNQIEEFQRQIEILSSEIRKYQTDIANLTNRKAELRAALINMFCHQT